MLPPRAWPARYAPKGAEPRVEKTGTARTFSPEPGASMPQNGHLFLRGPLAPQHATLSFELTCAGQDPVHSDIAFIARVLEDRSISAP